MKSIISSLVLAGAALVVSFSAVSAQAGGYGYGHHHHYTPVYRPVIVQKVIIPVYPVYPSYNYSFCH